MNTRFALRNEAQNETARSTHQDVSTIFNSVFNVELANSADAINEVFEIRYQVYCIDRPFEDPNAFADRREQDAYDHRSAHALIRHRLTRDSAAAVRLVMAGDNPAQADFPMEASCMRQMDQPARDAFARAPRKQVAEISRMAVSREFRRRLNEDGSATGVSDFACYSDSENGKRAMPYISLGLFSAILQMSVKHGITHWMAVMEPAQLRLLKRFGVEFDYVGPLMEYHGSRQPAFTEAASLMDRIKQRRPDVWSLITDGGQYLPLKPDTTCKEIEQKVA